MSKDEDPERTLFRPTGTPPASPGRQPPRGWAPDATNKAGAGWGPARAPVGPPRTRSWQEEPVPEAGPVELGETPRRALPKAALIGVGVALLLGGAGFMMAGGADEDAREAPATPSPAPTSAAATPAIMADAVPARVGEATPLAPNPAPLPAGSFSFPGAPADAYSKLVQPACQEAVADRYPFFGNAAADAAPAEVRRLFGPGGMLPSFVGGTLAPLIATDGPVWRWRPNSAAAFDPATPELLARLPALTALIGEGLSFDVEPVAFGGGVTAVELGLPGSRQRFDGPGPASRVQWRLPSQAADAALVLIKDGRPVRRYQEGGIWSLFRLIDKGRSAAEPSGATLVTFSDGTHMATLRLRAASGGQPFGRGGLWAFRCPAKL